MLIPKKTWQFKEYTPQKRGNENTKPKRTKATWSLAEKTLNKHDSMRSREITPAPGYASALEFSTKRTNSHKKSPTHPRDKTEKKSINSQPRRTESLQQSILINEPEIFFSKDFFVETGHGYFASPSKTEIISFLFSRSHLIFFLASGFCVPIRVRISGGENEVESIYRCVIQKEHTPEAAAGNISTIARGMGSSSPKKRRSHIRPYVCTESDDRTVPETGADTKTSLRTYRYIYTKILVSIPEVMVEHEERRRYQINLK